MGTSSGMVDTIFPGEEERDLGTLSKYDVFLNHRGPDLKKTFVSHLNRTLHLAGCEPFLDAKSLVKGKHAFNSINEALSGVCVHVAIFSQRYAESKYCLNELCDMLASEKPLIPVFYDVEPENLRWTEVGPFAEAFCKHMEKGRDGDVMRWKAALLQVANITGFRLVECDNDIVKLEEKIVGAVLDALPTPPPLPPARHPVGLKKSSEEVIDMLQKMGDNVGVIGICGMGGIGKTTLAKEVFNREHAKFGSWCFLSDVKEAKGVGVMDLQMKMMVDLLRVDVKKKHWDWVRWLDRIRKHKQKMLIVIDDISKRQQFDELIPDVKDLPLGSRVLITSRESGVLKDIMSDIAQNALFEVAELSFLDSMELFLRCAFRKSNIDEVGVAFHGFIKDITRACCGLPLALEVMGGFLLDKKNLLIHKIFWEEAILHLQRDGRIMTSLELSYNNLVEDEKRMFLDISCFMLGHPKRVAIEVWNSNDLYGSSSCLLSNLMDKNLVKVVDDRLSMHDLLRDMGRNVVVKKALGRPDLQSHIWDSSIAVKVLQRKKGSDKVLALTVVGEECGTSCKAKLYARMRELRYVLLDGCLVNGDFSDWCEELRWLQWRYMPYEEMPPTLSLPNLAVLDLGNSNCLTHVWPVSFKSDLENLCEDFGYLGSLRELDLSGCELLATLPASFSSLHNLEELNLSWCRNSQKLLPSFYGLKKLRLLRMSFNVELIELPMGFAQLLSLTEVHFEGAKQLQCLSEDFGSLKSLQKLNLGDCKSLLKLPDSFCELSNLEELDISGCQLLEELPPSIYMLKKLKRLDMGRTAIKELPEEFRQLWSMVRIDFTNCKQLQSLGEKFGCLGSLEVLVLNGCKSLKRLPSSFFELSNLEELDLSECEFLEELPPSIYMFKKLKRLSMRCTAVKELPEEFVQLRSLVRIDFTDCKQLRSLGEKFGYIGSLENLELQGCESLTMLPCSFSELSNLRVLDLSCCKYNQTLPPFIHKLKKLRELRMEYTALRDLPDDFVQLQRLEKVHFQGSKLLQCLCKGFGSLRSLKELDLQDCESLTKLPDSFPELSNLEELNLSGCQLLEELPPSIHKLKKLKKLYMRGAAIMELPEGFAQLRRLTDVDLRGCIHLHTLCEDFCQLKVLGGLNLSWCESLLKLPDSFSLLNSLEELDLSWCKELRKLPSAISDLKKLRILHMGSTALEALPDDFGQLHSLTRADFNNCKQLQNLCNNFGSLRSLEELNLMFCESLRTLPDSFSNLSKLAELSLFGCEVLQKMPPSVHGLQNLEVLSVGCTALTELPEDFGQLARLREADFRSCKQLQSLSENFGSLTSLWKLNLDGCGRLKVLPESFSCLSNMEELSLLGCKQILELPHSICRLKHLRVSHEEYGSRRTYTEPGFRYTSTSYPTGRWYY